MYVAKRPLPQQVLDRALQLASGSAENKLRAIDLLVGGEYSFSEELVAVLLGLASPNQPESVRTRLASMVDEGKLPFGAHVRISAALEKDPSEAVQKRPQKDRERWKAISGGSEAFFSEYTRSLSAMSEGLAKWGKLGDVAAQFGRLPALAAELATVRVDAAKFQMLLKAATRVRVPAIEAWTVGKNVAPLLETLCYTLNCGTGGDSIGDRMVHLLSPPSAPQGTYRWRAN